MDSQKDSASMTNSVKADCDGEKNRNCKNTSKQMGYSDNPENRCTSTQNQSSSFLPLNGSRPSPTNPITNDEADQQSKSTEYSAEGYKNIGIGSQYQNNKVNSNDDQTGSAVASSSKSSSNTYNCSDANQDVRLCQRHKVCFDKAGNTSTPSTSGSIKTCDNTEGSSIRENRKRPSSLKLNRPNMENEDSSSDTGNDDYSLGSEDGCIYTYRGGEHLADLPSSFFSLDMGLPLDKHLPLPPNYPVAQQGAPNVREQRSRASSPDMDFLEMDFDPGPSCEVDTGDESSPDADLDAASNLPEENEPNIRGTSPEYVAVAKPNPEPVPTSKPTTSHMVNDVYCVPSTSRGVLSGQGDASERPCPTYGPYITHINARGEHLLVRRTMSHWPVNIPISLHLSNGDLVSPREILNYPEEEHPDGSLAYQINQGARSNYDAANISSAMYHITMAKKLMVEKNKSECDGQNAAASGEASEPIPSSSTASMACIEPPRCMVWSEREACERQVTQIGTSACGATAVVNVFIALGVPVNIEKINSAVGTRQRANNAPLPRYLLSRSVAGCTAADLVTGINRSSDGLVTARFFPMYPERAVSLSHWLADWISLGAVPIVTLNLQVGCEGDIPDAWHHQMVFGVSSRGIYLCNPVECVRESVLWPRVTSPSVLLVRSRDILARFTSTTDLTPLMVVPDRRYHSFNVLGQVVNVVREWRAIGWGEDGTRTRTRTRHVRLPAAYQAGVTVAALTGSEAHRRLVLAAQLPILAPAHHADPV